MACGHVIAGRAYGAEHVHDAVARPPARPRDEGSNGAVFHTPKQAPIVFDAVRTMSSVAITQEG